MADSQNIGLKNETPVPVSLLSVQYFEEGGKVYKLLLPEAINSEKQLHGSPSKSNTVSRVKPIICHVEEGIDSAPLLSQSSIQSSKNDLLKHLSSECKIVKPFVKKSNSSFKNAVVVKNVKNDLCDNSNVNLSLHASHQDMCNSQNFNATKVVNYSEDKQTTKNILCSESLLESNLLFDDENFSIINEQDHYSDIASNYSSPNDRNSRSTTSVNLQKTDCSVSCEDLLQHFDQSEVDETFIREDASTQHNVSTSFKTSAQTIAVRKVKIFPSNPSSVTVNDQKALYVKVPPRMENCPLSEITTVTQTRVPFSAVSKTIDTQVPTKALAATITTSSQKVINLVPVTETNKEDIINLVPVTLSSSWEIVNEAAVTASSGQEIVHQIPSTLTSDKGIVNSVPMTESSGQELKNEGSITPKSDEMIPAFQFPISELAQQAENSLNATNRDMQIINQVPNLLNCSQAMCNCPVIGSMKNLNELPVVKNCSQRMVPSSVDNGENLLCCGKNVCNVVSCTANMSQVTSSQIKLNQVPSTIYTLSSPNSIVGTAVTTDKMVTDQVPISSSFGHHLHQQAPFKVISDKNISCLPTSTVCNDQITSQQVPILAISGQKIIRPSTPNSKQKILLLCQLHPQNHNQVKINKTSNTKVNSQITVEQHLKCYDDNLRQVGDKTVSCAKSIGCQTCNSCVKTKTVMSKTPVTILPNTINNGIKVNQSVTTLSTGQVNKFSVANSQVPFIVNSNPCLLSYQNQVTSNVNTQSSAVKYGNTSFSKITPQSQNISGQRINQNLNITTARSHFLVSQDPLRKATRTISNEKLVLTAGIDQHKGTSQNQRLAIQNSKPAEMYVLSGDLNNQYNFADLNLGNVSKNPVILMQDHVGQKSLLYLKPAITSTSQLSLHNQLVTSQTGSKLYEPYNTHKKSATKYIDGKVYSLMNTSSSVSNSKNICVPHMVSLLPGKPTTTVNTFNVPISVTTTTTSVFNINQPSFSVPVSLMNATPSLINTQYMTLSDPKSVTNTATPVFNIKQPSFGVPVSLMNDTPSLINTQYVALSDPKPVMNTATPVFNIQQPSISVPVSLTNATPSLINTATPVFNIKQPSFSVPVSLTNATQSLLKTKHVAVNVPKPVMNTATQVMNIKQPSFSVPVSLMNDTPSLINTQYVALSDPKPVMNTATPVFNIKQPSFSVPVSLANATPSLINTKHMAFNVPKSVMNTTTKVYNIKQPSFSTPVSLKNATPSQVNAKHVRFIPKLVMKTPTLKLNTSNLPVPNIPATTSLRGNINNSLFIFQPEPGISSLGSRVSSVATPLFTMANSPAAVMTALTESEKQTLKLSPALTSILKRPFHQNTYLGIGGKYQVNSVPKERLLSNSASTSEMFYKRILPNFLRTQGNQKFYIAKDINSCSQELTPSMGIHEQRNLSSITSQRSLDSVCTPDALSCQDSESQIKVVNVFSLATTAANKELSSDWKHENWNKPDSKECSLMGDNLQCLLEPEIVLTEEDSKSIDFSGNTFFTKHFGKFRKSKKKSVKRVKKRNAKARKGSRKKLRVGSSKQRNKTSSSTKKKVDLFQMELADESQDSLSDEGMYERYIYTKYEKSKVFEKLPLKKKLKSKKSSAKKHEKKKTTSHYAKKKSLLTKEFRRKKKSVCFYLDDINGSVLQECYVALDKLDDRLLGDGMVDMSETLEENLFVSSKRFKVELGRNARDEFSLSIPSDNIFKEKTTNQNMSVSDSDIFNTMDNISDVLQLLEEKKAALEAVRRKIGK